MTRLEILMSHIPVGSPIGRPESTLVQEFRREGSICLPEVSDDVMGIRECNGVDMATHDTDEYRCRLLLRVDTDGCVHAVIQNGPPVNLANQISNTNAVARLPIKTGGGAEDLKEERSPLLSMPGVADSQHAWMSAEVFDIPSIVQYSPGRDTMLTWRTRMKPIRWASQ